MNDQSTVRIVIGVLGLLALSVVIGGIVLALDDKSLPGELIAIGSAAAGAVGGILSKTASGPQEVQVVNAAADPVPVETDMVSAEERLRELGLYDDQSTTPDRGAVDLVEVLYVAALVIVIFCGFKFLGVF